MAKNIIKSLFKEVKPKKCRECGEDFKQYNSLHVFCTFECKKVYDEKQAWKKQKAELIDKTRTRTDWINLLQAVFNTYIRVRDKYLPCISCGKTKLSANDKWDAGHFWSTTYTYLRFNEDNVHKQCSTNCNMHKAGNTLEYRINLIKKIGQDRVDWLDENRHKELKLTESEIKELIATYKAKIKMLK